MKANISINIKHTFHTVLHDIQSDDEMSPTTWPADPGPIGREKDEH